MSMISAFSTTWFKVEVKCPICGYANQFQQIGSYGSYIYNWPEKFEYVFWPHTDSNSIYSCSKCSYSAFMWDFKSIGGDTLDLVKRKLKHLKLKVSGYGDKMTVKLEAAQKIYNLYIKDADFWCKFYRIKGYHYSKAKMPLKAQEERLKALKIAEDLLQLDENTYKQKELLLITSSMKYFTYQDSAAIQDINFGLNLKFDDPKIKAKDNKGMDDYLTTVLTQLRGIIRNGNKNFRESKN